MQPLTNWRPIDALRPSPAVLERWAEELPEGQLWAAAALVGSPAGRTYREAAALAELSVNTLKTHLRRIRQGQPAVWAEIAAYRTRQLAERHGAVVKRAERRSTRWHRKQFYRRFGYWPRERRQ